MKVLGLILLCVLATHATGIADMEDDGRNLEEEMRYISEKENNYMEHVRKNLEKMESDYKEYETMLAQHENFIEETHEYTADLLAKEREREDAFTNPQRESRAT